MSQIATQPILLLPIHERDHIRGNPEAPLTLLEYGDYECEYCGRAHPVVAAVRAHFGDRLKFVFRHFPHSSIHPHASAAAQAAEAAGAQGRFWEMHDLLYRHQTALEQDRVVHYALQLGLEPYHFQSDLSSERYSKRVASDYDGGVAGGVRKTPTFFIDGHYYAGPVEAQSLIEAIEYESRKRSELEEA